MKNDKINDLYVRLRAGEHAVRDLLIKALLDAQVPESCLQKFLRSRESYRYMEDDLYGVANLELVTVCEKLKTADVTTSVKAYVGEAITVALCHAISQAAIIHAPKSTRNDHKKRGTPLDLPQTCSFDDLGAEPWRDLRIDRDRCRERDFEEADFVYSCCNDEVDAGLLNWLEHGYSQMEVAGKLGISEAQVSRRLAGIEDRYDKKKEKLLCD